MGNLIKKILQNHSTRVLSLLFIVLLVLIGYFIAHSYFVQLNIHKSKILSRLDAVATSLSTQIDGNQLEYLLLIYPNMDDIKSNKQDRVYQLMHDQLRLIKDQNQLESDIYTLTFDSTANHFLFGVTSSDKPFYRHVYEHFPDELLKNYHKGGTINVYEDKNGHWLSAFQPIMNSKNETVGVIQVDQNFDSFLKETQEEIFNNIFLSLGVTLILVFFLIRSMRSILVKEDQLSASLLQSKLALEQKNQDTLDSILYAKKIQDAILPLKSKVYRTLPESFILHIPRDIVSGDFYWYKERNKKIYLAAVDCTGHGVPGAFMSMIGSILLDDVIVKKEVEKPADILAALHEGVVKALKQANRSRASRDGMDLALCVIDRDTNILEYSGAFRPLIHIRDGQLNRIKADPAPIGGYRKEGVQYTSHKIQLQEGDVFYIYTDGYADQFGGPEEKKYMTKRFRERLLEMHALPMKEQEQVLLQEFEEWKGVCEQVDDILVIGFKP